MIAAMWSGGKDSCLAVWRVLKSGLGISKLICMLNEEGVSRAHGLSKSKIEEQAKSVGMAVIFGKSDWNNYETEFKRIITVLKLKAIVFGDIYLEEHRSWIEGVCRGLELEIKPIFPLWGDDTRRLAEEFIKEGFEAYVIAVRKEIGREFIGRKYDLSLVNELIACGVDPCGENGEFHTYVVNGPLFKQRIQFEFGKLIEDEKYLKFEII
jgi:uncharacterized protein (TIGR00290 family)